MERVEQILKQAGIKSVKVYSIPERYEEDGRFTGRILQVKEGSKLYDKIVEQTGGAFPSDLVVIKQGIELM